MSIADANSTAVLEWTVEAEVTADS